MLTGYTPFLLVSGDFREAFNIFAIISLNPNKVKAMEHMIVKDNCTASTFVTFIHLLIVIGYFHHYEVLVMDNARIHTAEEASTVEDLLWTTEVDGRPLRVCVIYLPTRSPELNPIEYIFHILTNRIRRYRSRVCLFAKIGDPIPAVAGNVSL